MKLYIDLLLYEKGDIDKSKECNIKSKPQEATDNKRVYDKSIYFA